MTLPVNVGKGYVTGTFMDSSGTLAEGTVTFTPSPAKVLDATATPPTTILPQPVVVTLAEGTFLQQLVATDDDDLNPSGWTYTVSFRIKFGPLAVDVAPFSISLPTGGSDSPVDLTLVSPVASIDGTFYTRGFGVPDPSGGNDGNTLVLVDGVPAWATLDASYAPFRAGLVVAPSGSASSNVASVNAAITGAAAFGAPVLVQGAFNINSPLLPANGSIIDLRGAAITQVTNLTCGIVVNSGIACTIMGGTVNGVSSDWVNNSGVYAATGVEVEAGSGTVRLSGVKLLGWAGAGVNVEATAGDVFVDDCVITGAGSTYLTRATSQFGACVRSLSLTGKLRVSRCDLSNASQGVVTADGMTDVMVTNNRIHDIVGQHGSYIQSVGRLIYADNIVWNTGLTGMKIQLGSLADPDAFDCTVTDNVFNNCGDTGILVTNTAGTGGALNRRMKITNNTVDGAARGIEVQEAYGVLVNLNQIYNAVGKGVYVHDCTEVDVHDNRIDTTGDQGIVVENASQVWVLDNRIINPAGNRSAVTNYGIHVNGASSDVTLDGNRITDSLANMRYGIYSQTTDQATLTVRKNFGTGATDYGIRFTSAAAIREYENNDVQGTLGRVLNLPTSGRGRQAGESFGSAIPTTGTWSTGHLLWYTAPTLGGAKGAVCTSGGTPGTWDEFGALAPVSPWGGPAQSGMVGAAFDPLFSATNLSPLSVGVLFLVKVTIPAGGSIANLLYTLGAGATAATSGQCFMGIYAASAGGALLASSVDTSTVWGSAGDKATAVTLGAQPAGTQVYVAFLFNGTTPPTVRGFSASGKANVNVAAVPRFATAGTGLTALPSTLSTLTASVIEPWVGLA